MLFTVDFGKSPSSVFSLALTVAKKAPTFHIEGTPPQERYSATYDRLSDFIELAQKVIGWKSARLVIDSRQISRSEYFSLCLVNECYNKKYEFMNHRLYCRIDRNGSKLVFPCRFLRFYRYEFSEGKFGKIRGDVVLLDKDHLKFALEQQVRQTMCYCCPDMDLKLLLNSVDDWPNELPLEKDPFWSNLRTVDLGEGFDFQKQKEAETLEYLLRDVDGLQNNNKTSSDD